MKDKRKLETWRTTLNTETSQVWNHLKFKYLSFLNGLIYAECHDGGWVWNNSPKGRLWGHDRGEESLCFSCRDHGLYFLFLTQFFQNYRCRWLPAHYLLFHCIHPWKFKGKASKQIRPCLGPCQMHSPWRNFWARHCPDYCDFSSCNVGTVQGFGWYMPDNICEMSE